MTPEAIRWILTQALPRHVLLGLGGPEDISEHLSPLDDEAVHAIVGEIPALWPVSQILTLDILERIPTAIRAVGVGGLHEWVSSALERYESSGLAGARKYLDDVERRPSGFPARGGTARLSGLRKRLELYIGGLAGRRIAVAEGRRPSTDGVRIFLPESLHPGAGEEEQALLYKYAATVQWMALRHGTFLLPSPGRFFSSFQEPSLAVYVWNLLETHRLEGRISARLPGLARDMEKLSTQGGGPESAPSARRVGESLSELARLRDDEGELSGADRRTRRELAEALDLVWRPESTVEDTCEAARILCRALTGVSTDRGFPATPLHALGIEAGEFEVVRHELRKVLREEFIGNLAALILVAGEAEEVGENGGALKETPPPGSGEATTAVEEAVALLVDGRGRGDADPALSGQGRLLTLPNKVNAALEERLRDLGGQIRDDVGTIPREYVSAAQGMAGRHGMIPGMPGRADEAAIGEGWGAGDAVYDEWDARRQGYRKNWCRVVSLEPAMAGGNFVENTIASHYGTVQTLRRQFELLRRQERFVRRQRDGDDIDLDAGIEALTDFKAGLSPSERVFVRLQRDDRDISTLFLVDMSASTEGWVGTTIKESLVLLCEALQQLGDRYGIFGFSGMRRIRSEWYPIKGFDEPYDDAVRSRITGIIPRDYTRMGTAIRHATRILGEQPSRTRILLTLSDGKPEDYDDYKGDYAVEDTRKALIEARAAGIHPFCITVDREARGYLPHMFGERDYVLVPDVRLLPVRLPEIYRTITS